MLGQGLMIGCCWLDTKDAVSQAMLRHEIVHHIPKQLEALGTIVKDQLLPKSLTAGSAEKSVVSILGDINPNNKN
jgi:hypothetical protein